MSLDATFAALTEEIAAAREAILATAAERPEHWWDPYELKTTARNGWSAGAMSLALGDLVESGALEVGPGLCVRLPG